jgi:hypothetical protein
MLAKCLSKVNNTSRFSFATFSTLSSEIEIRFSSFKSMTVYPKFLRNLTVLGEIFSSAKNKSIKPSQKAQILHSLLD